MPQAPSDQNQQEERTYKEFRETDVWTKYLYLWEILWPHVNTIPEDDAAIASRLRTSLLGIIIMLAKARKIRYWDANRQASYLKTALEYLAEVDVLYALAVELEHLEPSEEFDLLVTDITRVAAGTLKSQAGHQRQSESSASDSET